MNEGWNEVDFAFADKFSESFLEFDATIFVGCGQACSDIQ